jgi:hypothetical protein
MALDRQMQIRDQTVAREAQFLKAYGDVDRKEALRAWRAEAASLLGSTFTHWAAEPARRQRQIGQCIAELETMAKQLFDRGWLLKHERLVEVARKAIEPVATAQAAGKIGDFYPYFRASVLRFVPVNADDLQKAARRDGTDSAHAGDLMAALAGVLMSRPVSPVEAIGERREEVRHEACKPHARRGRPKKFQAAEDATGDLFGG